MSSPPELDKSDSQHVSKRLHTYRVAVFRRNIVHFFSSTVPLFFSRDSSFFGRLSSWLNNFSTRLTPRERVLFGVSAVLGIAVVFGGRNLTDVSAREKSDTNLFQELKTFTDVLAIVKRDYVTEIENKKVVEGAIKGLLTTLDPHSGYLDPDFYQDLQVQTKGEFGGLGIEITIKDGLLVVVAPMEGSPAEKVGVKPGDVIIKIDGKFTKEFSLVDAVKRLRGPKGTPITISLGRKGLRDLLDVEIVRDNIAVKSVRSRYLGSGLGYVRISQFMEHTADDLAAALTSLSLAARNDETLAALPKVVEGSSLRGLLIDLRNNPGGLLAQAVKVGDIFLKEGVIVYTDGRIDVQKQKFFAHERGTEPDYPIVVLVNGGSASASEIIAGAMKDHGRAIVLGTQTFGKGSVQTITPLENGGAITLTTALYYTKSGNSIQAKGVSPDIEVKALVEEEAQIDSLSESSQRRNSIEIREEDLPGAIKNPSGVESAIEENGALKKINKTPTLNPEVEAINPETSPIDSWLERDVQFKRSLEVLKSFGDGGTKPDILKPSVR